MKWDVKHDRAKKVIDRFLDNSRILAGVRRPGYRA